MSAATSEVSSSALLASILGLILVLYVLLALLLYRVGKRLSYKRCWFAWISVANYWMICEMSGKDNPVVWFTGLLLLSIFSNVIRFLVSSASIRGLVTTIATVATLFICVMLWMEISERCGKPSWWAVMLLIPIVGLVFMYKMGELETITVSSEEQRHFAEQGHPLQYPVTTPGSQQSAGPLVCPHCNTGIAYAPVKNFCPFCSKKMP